MAFIGGRKPEAKANACPEWLVKLVVEDERPKRGEPGRHEYVGARWFSQRPSIPELIAAHKAELVAALRRAGASVAEAEAALAHASKWFA